MHVGSFGERHGIDRGNWSLAQPMNAARGNHTATLLPNGLVLFAGGSTSNASGGTTLASAERYTADRIFADGFDGVSMAHQ